MRSERIPRHTVFNYLKGLRLNLPPESTPGSRGPQQADARGWVIQVDNDVGSVQIVNRDAIGRTRPEVSKTLRDEETCKLYSFRAYLDIGVDN